MPTLPENKVISTTQRKKRPWIPILIGASLLLLLILVLGGRSATPAAESPSPSPIVTATPEPTPTPTPSPEPTPEPTPTIPPYDFTLPAPEGEEAHDDYFTDAVFIGDSRTDGLRLFGGVTGADFISEKGIMVFDVGTKKVIRRGEEKVTVLEALGRKQYKKVYLMLGVNELGYHNDAGFRKEYEGLVDKLRELQPEAVLYLQNLVAIHPDKAKANNQPKYVTNEQIAVYNEMIASIAAEKRTVLLDVNAALVGEDGILPREGTTDGVHFTKAYCVKWRDYLKTHTVDPDAYWAGQ